MIAQHLIDKVRSLKQDILVDYEHETIFKAKRGVDAGAVLAAGWFKVLLVLDPPYLCTHQASYKQERYFDLVDFLRLVDLTRPPYLFFSSTKSEFIRFINYLVEDKVKNWQVFDGAKRIAINTSASYSGKYEDNLVYKF